MNGMVYLQELYNMKVITFAYCFENFCMVLVQTDRHIRVLYLIVIVPTDREPELN